MYMAPFRTENLAYCGGNLKQVLPENSQFKKLICNYKKNIILWIDGCISQILVSIMSYAIWYFVTCYESTQEITIKFSIPVIIFITK